MDKKLSETTNLCVEIMNRKRKQVKGEAGSRGTNPSLPFDVNVILNLYYMKTKFFQKQSYRLNSDRTLSKELKKKNC